MSKYTDIDGLDDLFNLDDPIFQSAPTRQTQVAKPIERDIVIDAPPSTPTVDNTKPTSVYEPSESDVAAEISYMCREIKDIIQVAKYRITTSPDAETMHSAAQLFASASSLLKELNRGVLDSKKMKFARELEIMKIAARRDLAEFKAEQEAKKLPDLGTGNTINITQNNVQFSQEAIIDRLLARGE